MLSSFCKSFAKWSKQNRQITFRSAEESCESFDIGMGSQEGQLVSIKNSDRSWALQLFMDMGLPLDEQPENVWASTRWAWTGLRKTENNVGKIKKNNRYSVEDWQWADGIAPGKCSEDFANKSLFPKFSRTLISLTARNQPVKCQISNTDSIPLSHQETSATGDANNPTRKKRRQERTVVKMSQLVIRTT